MSKVYEHCIPCGGPLYLPKEKRVGACIKCAPILEQRKFHNGLHLACEAINS